MKKHLTKFIHNHLALLCLFNDEILPPIVQTLCYCLPKYELSNYCLKVIEGTAGIEFWFSLFDPEIFEKALLLVPLEDSNKETIMKLFDLFCSFKQYYCSAAISFFFNSIEEIENFLPYSSAILLHLAQIRQILLENPFPDYSLEEFDNNLSDVIDNLTTFASEHELSNEANAILEQFVKIVNDNP